MSGATRLVVPSGGTTMHASGSSRRSPPASSFWWHHVAQQQRLRGKEMQQGAGWMVTTVQGCKRAARLVIHSRDSLSSGCEQEGMRQGHNARSTINGGPCSARNGFQICCAHLQRTSSQRDAPAWLPGDISASLHVSVYHHGAGEFRRGAAMVAAQRWQRPEGP